MTTPASPTRRNTALSILIVILAAIEVVLAAIGRLVWHAYQQGHLTTAESATFALLGASAAVGVVLYLIAAFALARHSRTAANLSAVVAGLRLGAVLVVLAVIAVQLGSAALAGLLQTAGAILAVLDALLALSVTNVAVRRTRRVQA